MRKFISGLVLGAGASQRFGQPKQLLPFRDTTMLGWVVDQAQQATSLDEVVIVLGRAAEEVRERVDFGAARVVENPVFGEGCSSSYRAGIGALDAESAAIMIILGDLPGITPARARRSDCALFVRRTQGPSDDLRALDVCTTRGSPWRQGRVEIG
jgi:molybdenum cofactor cytidylyltransferase